MIKSVDILGLPVISINEGYIVGIAKGLVIDPIHGLIAALVIDDGKWYLGAKLLPFAKIEGLGKYAITVENSDNIVAVVNAPDLEKYLVADVKIIGSQVLTEKGADRGRSYGNYH